MPKRKASEAPTPVQEKPTLEQKKPGNEIDEIFSSKKKKKKLKQEQTDKLIKDAGVKSKMVKKKTRKSKIDESDVLTNQSSRPRKHTDDGLALYTEEELGISRSDAGGTGLCPFDCSCCF